MMVYVNDEDMVNFDLTVLSPVRILNRLLSVPPS